MLVVDDEATVRMLVVDVLEEFGYRALQAADGASGLDVLQSSAAIDLLVTDVGMPGGMNGRQLAEAARAIRPGLRVLLITGYAEAAVARRRPARARHARSAEAVRAGGLRRLGEGDDRDALIL